MAPRPLMLMRKKGLQGPMFGQYADLSHHLAKSVGNFIEGESGFYELVSQSTLANGATITLVSGFTYVYGRDGTDKAFPQVYIDAPVLPNILNGESLTFNCIVTNNTTVGAPDIQLQLNSQEYSMFSPTIFIPSGTPELGYALVLNNNSGFTVTDARMLFKVQNIGPGFTMDVQIADAYSVVS